jgi:hypothetical protein
MTQTTHDRDEHFRRNEWHPVPNEMLMHRLVAGKWETRPMTDAEALSAQRTQSADQK